MRTGCYLPVSGHVAYDALELECWELARASRQQPGIPLAARARFVVRGLFYNYEALDTDRKAYFFGTYPCEVARTYVRAAPGSAQLAARLAEVPDRAWRRRYHRQWAGIQIEDRVRQEADRHRLLLWHRLIGAAREFDEEKRRLNMPLWRSLFALADGLGVSLLSPGGIDELCSAVERQQGGIVVDSVFRFGTDSRGNA